MMAYQKALRSAMGGLALLLTGYLFVSRCIAQESKQVKVDWEQIEKAFGTYFASPTEGNAERVLSGLPNRVDEKTIHIGDMNSTIRSIYNTHIVDLSTLIKKNNRLALRIAYNLYKFTDGFYAGQVTGAIGDSIVVMPNVFLEETLIFRKNNPESKNDYRFYTKCFYTEHGFLDQILCGYIDFDQFRPDVIEKEISARIKALESVDREDLLELRDDCLRRLGNYLKTLRRHSLDR